MGAMIIVYICFSLITGVGAMRGSFPPSASQPMTSYPPHNMSRSMNSAGNPAAVSQAMMSQQTQQAAQLQHHNSMVSSRPGSGPGSNPSQPQNGK